MQFDRTKVTPEIIQQMRETLRTAGVDTAVMEDEEVIERIEKLLDVVVDIGIKMRTLMLDTVTNVAKSPAVQQLIEISELPGCRPYIHRERPIR